jgi:hypothetical protein
VKTSTRKRFLSYVLLFQAAVPEVKAGGPSEADLSPPVSPPSADPQLQLLLRPPLTTISSSDQQPADRHSPDLVKYPTRQVAASRKGADQTAAAPAPLKRSIFKSKAAAQTTALPKKALSLYRHNLGWGGQKEEEFSSIGSSRAKLKEQEEKGTVPVPVPTYNKLLRIMIFDF